MRPLRVLAVIETLARGGAETLLLHLGPALAARGVSLEVAALMPPYDLQEELEAAGVTVHTLDGPSGWRIDVLGPRLTKLVRRRRPDVVHAHLFFAAWTTAWLPDGLFTGPRMLSLHMVDYVEHPPRTPWQRIRKRMHRLILARRMTHLVAVSMAVAEHYREEMGSLDIDVIYNALPVERLPDPDTVDRDAVRQRHGFGADDDLVVTIGRFTEQKGHVHLIDAARTLVRRHPRLKVAIVGQGPLEASYRQRIADAELDDVVRIVAPMPHAELMAFVASGDAFVMPSVYEGFGIATAEGMALARPVVATDIPAFLEFVTNDETGIVVRAASASSLADGIATVLQDDRRAKRLAAAARASILARFDTPVIADQWAEHYRSAVGEVESRTRTSRRWGARKNEP